MVSEGGRMMDEAIFAAQDYLTIEKDEVRKRIVDIEGMHKRQSKKEILTFLKDCLSRKQKVLKNLILIDKAQRRVDETVVSMFRLSMAIKTLEDNIYEIADGKEVKPLEQLEQGTEESGGILKRDRCRHRRAGIRKNPYHDGANRDTGERLPHPA